MEPFIDILCEDPRWDRLDLAALAEAAIGAGMDELGLSPEGFCLCILACNDARIAALNGDFRGKAKATNVLSWPAQDRSASIEGALPPPPEPGSQDDPESLGDIALAYETIEAEAASAGKKIEDHLSHLILHGFLHLLGFDHIRDGDAALMEGIEAKALARLGLCDPYSLSQPDPEAVSSQKADGQ